MGFAQTNTFAGTASTSFNSGSQGLLGGFFAGGDWQFSPQALVGVMADYTFQGITGGINLTTPGGSAYATAEQNRQWSVMGRLGWLPVPSTLLYAAGGYSQLNVRASAGASLGGVAPFAQRDTSFSGFTVGPGIETAVTGGWTTRLEYRFSQFEQKEVMSGVTYQPSNHTIRAGISYKFGFGGKTHDRGSGRLRGKMRSRILTVAMAIAAGLAAVTAEAQQGNTINVVVSGIKDNNGISVAACSIRLRPSPRTSRSTKGVEAPIANGQATCTFTNVPPGTYAVAYYKAAPGQTKMNTGMFGSPAGSLRLLAQRHDRHGTAVLQLGGLQLCRRQHDLAGDHHLP